MARERKMPRIEILDTTLRDGEQGHPGSFNLEQKYKMALELDKLGVDVIEAGFPIVSKTEIDIFKKLKGKTRAKLCALSSTHPKHVTAAIESGAHRINIFIPCSVEQMLVARPPITPREAVANTLGAIKMAKKAGMEIEITMMDAAHARPRFLSGFAKKLKKAGAQRLTLSDTKGALTAKQTTKMFRRIKRATKLPLSAHVHCDHGDPVELNVAAIKGGATQVHTTIGGIGERAGNTSLEAIIAQGFKHGFRTGINTKILEPQSHKIAGIGRFKIPERAPLIGKRTQEFRAGMHMKEALGAYSAFRPEDFGGKTKWMYGKGTSGKVTAELAKQLGYTPSREEVNSFVKHLKRYGERGHEKPEAYIKTLISRAERMRAHKAAQGHKKR
jgi:isopropylmalate/homocitrate/citramalate synthase